MSISPSLSTSFTSIPPQSYLPLLFISSSITDSEENEIVDVEELFLNQDKNPLSAFDGALIPVPTVMVASYNHFIPKSAAFPVLDTVVSKELIVVVAKFSIPLTTRSKSPSPSISATSKSEIHLFMS